MDHTPLSIVGGFYEASLAEGRWASALDVLRQFVDADCCALVVHDFESGTGRILQSVGIAEEHADAYARRYSRFNLWLQQETAFAGAPLVINGTRIVPEAEIARSVFSRDWLQPQGLNDHLFMVLDRRASRITVAMLGRAEHRGPFEAGAASKLDDLAAPLAHSYLAGQAVRRQRALLQAAEDTFDRLPLGIIHVNAGGGVIVANRIARAVLADAEALHQPNGSLMVEAAGRRIKLKDVLQQMLAADAGGEPLDPLPLSVPRQNGQRSLTLVLAPTPISEWSASDDAPAAVLYIGDPERGAQIDHARLIKLYGLSRAESRVAALLASGYRLDQAAEILGVAYETVRKHLKQIFSKTGTFRQAELVRMVVTGPAGLTF